MTDQPNYLKIEIELGNEAMQTADDVINTIVDRLKRGGLKDSRLYDTNGNFVGEITVQ